MTRLPPLRTSLARDYLDGSARVERPAVRLAANPLPHQFGTGGRAGRAVTGTLTWWGHSTCTWQDGGTTVLFDPVLTARLGHLRRVRGPVPPPHAAHADLILISHLHADHTHLPSLRLHPTLRGSHRPSRLAPPAQANRRPRCEAPRGRAGDLVEFGGLQIRVLAADHDGRRHPGSPHRGTRARLSCRGLPPVLVSGGHWSAACFRGGGAASTSP